MPVKAWIALSVVLSIWMGIAPDGAEASGQAKKGEKPSCDKVVYESLPNTLAGAVVLPKTEVDCSLPVGLATVTNPTTPIQLHYAQDPPQAGGDCSFDYDAGPTFTRQSPGIWEAGWTDPDGKFYRDGAGNGDLPNRLSRTYQAPPPGGHIESVAPLLGFNLVQVPMQEWGRVEVQGGQVRCRPWDMWRPQCSLNLISDGPSQNACVKLTPYVPTPPGGPEAVVPRAQIRALLQNPGRLDPGRIQLAPTADRGLVNLPQHAWIEGATVQQPGTWEFAADSLPDATGRGLRYQYLVTVGLSGVDWSWGDGAGDWWPDLGEVGADGHNPTHSYRVISARGGGGPVVRGSATYTVQAVEHYTVDVMAVWFDGRGSRSQDLGDLGLSLDGAPPPAALYVGQLEGVPSA